MRIQLSDILRHPEVVEVRMRHVNSAGGALFEVSAEFTDGSTVFRQSITPERAIKAVYEVLLTKTK